VRMSARNRLRRPCITASARIASTLNPRRRLGTRLVVEEDELRRLRETAAGRLDHCRDAQQQLLANREEFGNVWRLYIGEELELDRLGCEVDEPDARRLALHPRMLVEELAHAGEDRAQLLDARTVPEPQHALDQDLSARRKVLD